MDCQLPEDRNMVINKRKENKCGLQIRDVNIKQVAKVKDVGSILSGVWKVWHKDPNNHRTSERGILKYKQSAGKGKHFVLYGSECCTITPRTRRKLEVTGMWNERRILRIR